METSAIQATPEISAPHAGSILGIDPGLRRTGFAFLVERAAPALPWLSAAGVIRLDPELSLEYRLCELERNLDQLIQEERPTALACEQLFAHYKHPRTAILMGHARGVILALAARRSLRVVSVPATHAKKLITGKGHAGKETVQRAVTLTLGLARPPEPHDVSDAIALAIAGARMLAAEQAQSSFDRPSVIAARSRRPRPAAEVRS